MRCAHTVHAQHALGLHGANGQRDACACIYDARGLVQVTAQGHTTKLKPGTCSPRMMQGSPYIHQAPRYFHTKPDHLKVHWDGRVWCP